MAKPFMLLLAAILAFMQVGSGVAQASTPGAETDPSKEVEFGVFVLENFTRPNGDGCKPDIDATAIIRIEDSQGNAWTLRFSRAQVVDQDNDYAPGEPGCFVSTSIPFDASEQYTASLNDRLLVEFSGTLLADGDPFIIVFDKHRVFMEEESGLTIPTPVPTPRPTSTPLPPAPTPTPKPAGDQGDGFYLVRGYLTLRSDNVVAAGDFCFGTGGYSDIGSGTQVVIRDGNNNVMGIGELVYSEEMTFGTGCTFMFEIEVEETRFYQIEMSHRGEMIFTFEDLEENRWTVFLTLGR